MLNPNDDRLDYGKVLAAPDGYHLDFAVGTTYSLDLDALVGACLALGLSEDTDSDLMKNPICLLEALRATGDKVALFCEAGQIHMPENVTPLYILLEKMVFQVNTHTHSSFHPKFWLLRYAGEGNQPLYRVAVLSRNLTFDRSWDVTFCMDGKTNRRKTLKTEPIIDFVTYLADNLSADDNGKLKQKRMKALIRELPYVHFEINSEEFEDFEFLPTGIKYSSGGLHSTDDKAFFPLFKDTFHELLIMSPFLTGSVIKAFNDRNTYIDKADRMLITRALSLGKLKPADCTGFRIFTMKDAVVDGESAISEEALQIQKQDIHAKVYMVRKNSDSYLYLGSLNASHNALYGNIEFMVMLKSSSRYLNLTRLSEALFDGGEASAGNPFQEVTLSNAVSVDEEQEMQGILESYIKDINRMKPYAAASENEDNYDLTISFAKYEQCKYKVRISPLLSNKSEELAETIQFSSLQLTQLSKFYKVVITDGQRTARRVIIIPTDGLPEDRERAVVNSVVKDKECFYRYIAFLLGDNLVLGAVEANYIAQGSGMGTAQKKLQIPPLYEKMLQAAATAPERFTGIDYLIKTVSSDGVIPEEFEELYAMFKKAMKL